MDLEKFELLETDPLMIIEVDSGSSPESPWFTVSWVDLSLSFSHYYLDQQLITWNNVTEHALLT